MERINAEVFVEISRLGSYRKAAEKLGYTTAGISYIVDNMEEYAGLHLFVRKYGGVRLTSDGKALLPFMQKLFEYEQIVDEQIDRIKGIETGNSQSR